MGKRIFALILCVAALLGLLSGCGGREAVEAQPPEPLPEAPTEEFTYGEMIELICDRFGMINYREETPYFSNVTSSNPHFAAVQAGKEWSVIEQSAGSLDLDAKVTRGVLAAAVVNAAELASSDASKEEKIAIAAEKSLVASNAGRVDENQIVAREEAIEVIEKAQAIWANKTYTDVLSEVVYQDDVRNYAQGDYAISVYQVSGNQVVIPKTTELSIGSGDTYVLAPQEPAGDVYVAIAASVEETAESYIITNRDEEPDLGDIFEEIHEHATTTPNLLRDCVIYGPNGELISSPTDVGSENSSALGVSFTHHSSEPIRASLQAADTYATIEKMGHRVEKLALAQNGSLSFTIDGITVTGTISDNAINFGMKGPIKDSKWLAWEGGVEISDISVTHDVDFGFLSLKSATLKLDYKTKISGGVKATAKIPSLGLVPYNNANNPFMTNLKNSSFHFLGDSRKGATSIKICTIELAGIDGVVGVRLNVRVNFKADGTFTLSVTLGGSKGIEYKDGTLRYINSTSSDWDASLKGKFEVTASIGAGLHVAKKDIIAVAADGGIGVAAELIVHLADSEHHLIEESSGDLPADIEEALQEATIEAPETLVEQIAKSRGGKYVYTGGTVRLYPEVCFDVKFYWVVKVGIDDECLVKDIIGDKAKLSVEFCNAKNAEFAHWHLENMVDVGKCTRKYTPFDMETLDEVIEKDREEARREQEIDGALDIQAYTVNINVGDVVKMNVTSVPQGYSEADLVWSSKEPSIATVDADGNIRGISAGSTMLTLSLKNNSAVSVKCVVFVDDKVESNWEFLPTAYKGGVSVGASL